MPRLALLALGWIFMALVGMSGSAAQAQQAFIQAGDAAAVAWFGSAISMDGDRLLVGAPGDRVVGADGAVGTDAGAAYLFVRQGGQWVQWHKLTAPDAAPEDLFGYAVAVRGAVLVVGAPGEDEEGSGAGAAYVFVDDPILGWTYQEKLVAPDGALGDAFGTSVAVAPPFILIGAPGEDEAGFEAGAAYAFQQGPSGWVAQPKLRALGAAAGDAFGSRLALLGDLALVGAPRADEPRGQDAGLAHVFQRSGGTWNHKAVLTAGDAFGGYHFGSAVALLQGPDTQYAFVGAPSNGNQGREAGAAYVFANFDTTWAQQTRLIPGGTAAGDRFGMAVAAANDRLYVGAPGADHGGFDTGAVYVFRRERFHTWPEQARRGPLPGRPCPGYGQALSAQGMALAVGTPRCGTPAPDAGGVFVWPDTTPLPQERQTAAPTSSLSAYPNPFNNRLTITYTGESLGPSTLTLYDTLGRRVLRMDTPSGVGAGHQIQWTPPPLPPGLYWLQRSTPHTLHTIPLIHLPD